MSHSRPADGPALLPSCLKTPILGRVQRPETATHRAHGPPHAGHGLITVTSVYPATAWIGLPGVLVAVLIGVTVYVQGSNIRHPFWLAT